MPKTPHSLTRPTLVYEFRTIDAMIHIFCRDHHKPEPGCLCRDCIEIRNYAEKRLLHCPFQANKPTCGNCTVHCYKNDMRVSVKEIMRYAGPKMIFTHPVMAVRHLLAGRRKAPLLKEESVPGKASTEN